MEDSQARQFDLNIERVLEHWTVAHALREIIANALDEQALTSTADPTINKDEEGAWHIKDSGRGISYEHLTQNENKEKLRNPGLVIGKFGVGLKDALATCDRHHIQVASFSSYGDITIGKTAKHGFTDIVTLHAMIYPPSHPDMVGTEFVLTGVKDEDIAKAKDFFLKYSGDEVLEQTKYGDVLQTRRKQARIYVNGLCVAEEDNFLFSYNITSLTTALRKALNRERANVGRSAYTDRVKAILLECSQARVAEVLAQDLKNFETGKIHDELQWIDVSLHACRILNATEKVIFLTAEQLRLGSSLITHAQQDGYRVIVVPSIIAFKLPQLKDIEGQPIRDLGEYREEWDRSFQFTFIAPEQLSPDEQRVFELTQPLLRLLGKPSLLTKVREVRISETMRVDNVGNEVVGVWELQDQYIVIRRDQLRALASYAGTLLHEATHALTEADDGSFEFEQGLTQNLGKVAASAIKTLRPPTPLNIKYRERPREEIEDERARIRSRISLDEDYPD
jgi:hypothetical protein